MVTLGSGFSAISASDWLLGGDSLRELTQLAYHLGVGEGLGLVAHRTGRLHDRGAELLWQLGDSRAWIAPLGMLLVQRLAALLALFGYRVWPLDPYAELVEVLVEEDEGRDRLELALVQVLAHDRGARLGVAQVDADVELASRLVCDLAQDRHVGDHVTAPVFGQRHHVQRARQT